MDFRLAWGETTHDDDTTPEGPCTRAGIVDDVDAVAGPRTQLPREPCWCCTTAASEHNSRGTSCVRSPATASTNTTPKGVVLVLYDGCSERASTTPEGTMHSMLISVGETRHGDGHNSRGTMHACSHCRHRGHSSRPTNATPKGPAR